jgi:spermidine synthase
LPFNYRGHAASFICVLMFFSGASSLILEMIFFRLLSYTFGNTAYAASTVLAVFMGGLAIGAATIGKWCAKQPASLRIYGFLELSIAGYCLEVPAIVSAATMLYVYTCGRLHMQTGSLLPVQVGFAILVIALPAILMGGTLPAVAHFLSARTNTFETAIDRVYAANTFGAAVGTMVAAYILIPTIGLRGALWFACGIDGLIFLAAVTTHWDEIKIAAGETGMLDRAKTPSWKVILYLAISFLSGAVTLAYEVVWNHALSFLVGNTVYAFGLMLFSILVGLAAGSRIVARRITNPGYWPVALILAQLLTGIAVFATLPFWQYVPSLFSSGVDLAHNIDVGVIAVIVIGRLIWLATRRSRTLESRSWFQRNEHFVLLLVFALVVWALSLYRHSDEIGFIVGDLLRLVCAFGLLIVPSVLLGITFPLLLNLCSQSSGKAAQIGRVYAVNTCGTVVGSLLAGFVLLSHLGSFGTLRALALTSIGMSVLLVFLILPTSGVRRALVALAIAGLAGLLSLSVRQWNQHRVTSGNYAYFGASDWSRGEIRFMKEDIQSGLTTVVQQGSARALLTNGKYQGDNTAEMATQLRFALVPMLFAKHTDRALVIGLGTGNTLRTVAHFPFRAIDVVEISPGVVEASRKWFTDVNDGIFDSDPRIRLTLGDARNFLLLSRDKYDLITIEITSLWISGEADLYNKEFYDLASKHLAPGGVLQQWVAIHHLRQEELFLVLNTAAKVFPNTAFFVGTDHGLLIASAAPLTCNYPLVESFNHRPELQRDFAALKIPDMWALLPEMRLFGDSMRQAIDTLAKANSMRPETISTDLFPRLEYGSPKGLTLSYDTFSANYRFLKGFQKDYRSQIIRNEVLDPH